MAALWKGVMTGSRFSKLTYYTCTCILLLHVVVMWISPVSGGRYGMWVCTSSRQVVSSGSFQNSGFAPFISPQKSGSVHQDGCDNKYYRDLDCTFTFKAPVGHLIYVEFSTIKLDRSCSEDFLDMYLGRGLRRLCGQRGLTYDISDGKQMTLRFRSNEDNECSGFAGYFTAFPDAQGRRRKRRASASSIARLQASYPTLQLDSGLHKRRTRRTTYSSLLALVHSLSGVSTSSIAATSGTTKPLHSALVLNLQMTWFRLRNFLYLRHCRRRVETDLWNQPACSICKFGEVSECVCRAPSDQTRRRRRSDADGEERTAVDGALPRKLRARRFVYSNDNNNDGHDCRCRQ